MKKVAWSCAGFFICGHPLIVNWNKIITGSFTAIFALIFVWSGLFFLQLHREYSLFKAQETANQRHLAEAETRLREQEKYLDQLRHDPALVERIIRQKLGYTRPGEFVFRFEDRR